MFKDRGKLYQVYHTVLTLTLTWALMLVMNKYFYLKVPIALTAFYSFVPALLIYLVDINKKNLMTYLLLGSSIPILGLVFWISRTNPLSWVRDLFDWCMMYDGTEELYRSGFAHVVVIGAAILAAVLFYLLTGQLVSKIILAVVLLAVMIILSISQAEINKAVVAIIIFYVMTIIVEVYGIIYSRKSNRVEKKEGILYLAPICLLLAILSIALPSKPEPIQWKAVKYVYNNVKEQLEIWRTEMNYYFGKSRSEFFVSLTGYSEDNGELKNEGDLIKDNKVAMKITGLDKGKSAYLIGSVSDIYTGSSWEKSRLDYLPDQQEYFLDYIELIYALSRQDMEVLENNRFTERRVLRVEYNNIRTKTFFYPIKMSAYDVFSNYRKLTSLTPQINFQKARGKGTSYQTIFFEMNLEGEAFIRMLQEAEQFSYDNELTVDPAIVNYVQSKLLPQDDVDEIQLGDFYTLLRERSEMIEKQYTALPEELPDRVYQLAEEITSGCETKYDKLKAIENYLIANYTYSLEAQKLPEGQDFIDYFLFDSKQGYCTSYASAVAVLGRCVGIPTRYVEGFLGAFKIRDDNYNYLVKNSQAHAWAEAYIEGVGWIPFEATTPFYGNRYTQWAEFPKANSGNAYDSGIAPEYPAEDAQPLQPEEEVVIVEEDNTTEIISAAAIFASTLVIMLLVLIIYYYVMRYRYKKNYERADSSRKMYLLFLRILSLLRREGFVLEQQETILMLSERVKKRFEYDGISFYEVANIFMRYRYAEEAVCAEELKQVTIFHQGLKDKRKAEDSWFKVWWEELMFLARKANY